MEKKYISLTRLSDFLDNIKAKYSQIGHKHAVADITDYIENRTHWKEDGELQVLFDGSIEITNGSGPAQDNPVSIMIYEGMPYEVVYGGTTYSLVGKVDNRGTAYIGSDSLWAKDTYVESEPPFCYGAGFFEAAVDGTYTLTISGHNITWYTIDKHYLPGALPMHGTARGAEKFNYEGNTASGKYSHAEGYTTRATGYYSHAENYTSIAQGLGSHAEGSGFANGAYSHAEGFETSATGVYAHAEGNDTTASESSSHAEGYQTEASGQCSHAEGSKSKAQAIAAHAEGFDTTASGQCSHAEGYQAVASGYQSHAEGLYSKATGTSTHAEGKGTIAVGNNQHVQGKYNIADNDSQYAHIVGNGTAEDEKDENGNIIARGRSNAHTIDWNGNAWFAGDIRVGGTSYADAVSLVPKRTTITLSANAWTGDSNPWSQVVTMNGVTVNSKIDLHPTALQIIELQNSDIALMAENDDGVVTVYALGDKPTVDYTIQALITEVAVV
jgi:hypothetical protein